MPTRACLTGKDATQVARVDGLMKWLAPAAQLNGIDPRLLAAVALRESGGENIAENGHGGGAGIFQLTGKPAAVQSQAYNIPFAANYAASMLASALNTEARKFPGFTPDQRLQGAADIYNLGHISGNPATMISERPAIIMG